MQEGAVIVLILTSALSLRERVPTLGVGGMVEGRWGTEKISVQQGRGETGRSIVLLRRRFSLNGWHGGEEALADLLTLILRLDMPGEKMRRLLVNRAGSDDKHGKFLSGLQETFRVHNKEPDGQ